MGVIWSRWRKKPTTLELLESIDQEISVLEKAKQGKLDQQRHIIGALLLYSVLGYIVAVIVFYAWYLPDIWPDRILYSLPLVAFPFLIWAIKILLHWYFVKRISKNEHALEEMKEKKNTILEEVMEKETYKKAKEILDRFDPDRHSSLEPQGVDGSPLPQRARDGQELRRRNVPGQATPPVGASPALGRGKQPLQMATPVSQQMSTPMMPPPSTAHKNGQPVRAAAIGMTPGMRMPAPPGPPMPRPVLPRDRSVADRMLEMLIGDGPHNRYALICKECSSHNGMALKEEFEFLSFRCCYCYTLNPARKERPKAPRLSFSRRLRETENKKKQEAQSKMRTQSKEVISKSEKETEDSEDFTEDESFVDDPEAKTSRQSVR